MLTRDPETYTNEELSNIIHRWVTDKVPENIRLDYKETLNLDHRNNRKELCKDVTSFANELGGTILYGVPQDQSENKAPVPRAPYGMLPVPGLPERIENVLTDGVRPLLPSLRVREVPVKSDPSKVVYLVWHGASLYGPHMVTSYGEYRFYRRGNYRSMVMDVEFVRQRHMELALALGRVDGVLNRLSDEWNVMTHQFSPRRKTKMYFVPHYLMERLNINDRLTDDFSAKWASLTGSGWKASGNGLASMANSLVDSTMYQFVEVWRNGVIRSIRDTAVHGTSLMDHIECEQARKLLEMADTVYKEAVYDGPLRIRLQFDEVSDLSLQGRGSHNLWPFVTGVDPFIIDIDVDTRSLRRGPDETLRKLADRLFQGFGMTSADRCFDEGGRFKSQ